MTDESDALTITSDQLADLLSFSAVFTVIEDATQNLSDVEFSDDEVGSFDLMPEDFRLRCVARLLELAEMMRDALRDLDGRILQLNPQAV